MAVHPNRKALWFGTEERMGWFPTPLRGADSTPEGWGTSGTLLNGGGYGFNSWGTHKTYTYEWPESSSPEVAQMMKSYRDGTYGRGLLYFIDPLTYGTNILPALWADPGMAVGGEGPSIVPGIEPEAVPTSGWEKHGLPVYSALFSNVPASSPVDIDRTLFIPIPEGYELRLGAFYTGSATISAVPVLANGSLQPPILLPQTGALDEVVTNTGFSAIKGVRLWVNGPGNLTVTALIARLIRLDAHFSEKNRFNRKPWIGGQGHSGCIFQGTPSYVSNSPIAGGRIGFAATFKEVGSWQFGL